MNKAIMVVIVFTLCSCSLNPDNAKKIVDDGIKEADAMLQERYVKNQHDLSVYYKSALRTIPDSAINSKFTTYYSSLIETVKYIDSLKTELKKIDTNIFDEKPLRIMFIRNGELKLLARKISRTDSLAKNIALTQKQKLDIDNSQNDLNKITTDDQYNPFVHGNAGGDVWLLYGCQEELMSKGIIILKSYTKQ